MNELTPAGEPANELTETRDIPAPASAVWAVISDVEHLPDVLTGMTALRIEGDDPALRPGLAWAQTRVISGRSGSERLSVATVDDGREYTTTGGGAGFIYLTAWRVEPTGDTASRLTCTFRAEPRGWFARLMLRLFARSGEQASRDAMRTDLLDIERAATGAAR